MSELTTAGGYPPGSPPPTFNRSAALARNWWAIGFRGVFAIVVGLIALLIPAVTLGSLVLLFAFYMLFDGVFAIVSGIRAAAHHERWGVLILEGVLDLVAGGVALFMPALTVIVLITLLGIWSVLTGALLLIAAFKLHISHGRWWLGLAGLVSLVWGALLFSRPIAGAVVLTIWFGAYALVFGFGLLVLAWRLHAAHGAVRPGY